MKKTGFCALVAAILCIFTLKSTGQDYSLGLKIGVSQTTLSGSSDTDLTWRSAFAGGFVFTARFLNSLAVQPELIYVVKGAKTDNIFQNGEPTGFEGIFSFSYLDVPVLLMFTPETRSRYHPKVFAGPHLSYQLDASIEQIDPNTGNSASEPVDTIHDTDYGLVFGAGTDVEISGELVTFDVRYVWSRNNIRPNVASDPLYNRGILFMLGVSF